MRRISVQLWSLRDETAKNFPETLTKLAKIGFKAVEPAGFGSLTVKEFKNICDDLGLSIPSSHSPWVGLDNISAVMDTAHELGLTQLACGYGADDFANLDSIKRAVENSAKIYEIISRNGFGMFQHNHAFEFERLDGKLKYDYYLEQLPEVKLELDTYWCANFGAENPVEIIKKYQDRLVLAHIKDGTFVPNAPNVALGEGKMDVPAVINALPDSVKTIVIEFDSCASDIFAAVEKSFNFLKERNLGE